MSKQTLFSSIQKPSLWLLCLLAVNGESELVVAAPLVNGDFETGTFAGWTTFTTPKGSLGFPPVPNVVQFDTTSLLSSFAAKFQVGDAVASGVREGGGILQSVVLNSGALNVSLDIASQTTFFANADAGLFEVLVDGLVIGSHNFGTIDINATERATLIATTSVNAGSHEIAVRITRGFFVSTSSFQFVDNITLSGAATQTVPESGSLSLFVMCLIAGGGSCYLVRSGRLQPHLRGFAF